MIDALKLAECLMVMAHMEEEMTEREPDDLELLELRIKVVEMADWLDKAFSANCAEDDYCEGCASCDAGVAIRALQRIEATLKPFVPKGGDSNTV